MEKYVNKPLGKLLTLWALMIITQLGIILTSDGRFPYDYIIIPLTVVSSIWIMFVISEYLKIFSISQIHLKKSDAKSILKWFSLVLLVKLLSGVILTLEGSVTTNNQELIIDGFSKTPIVLIFLLVVVAAPIMEEITVRGFIMKKCFSEKHYIGVVVSSLLFGLLHRPTTIGSFLIYSSMGFIFGMCYKKTDRIELSIILHMLNNLLGFLVFL